jgi:hypothetical protein
MDNKGVQQMMQSVQVIIERLKSHPEDFFGDMEGRLIGRHAPKFDTIREKLDDLLLEKTEHPHRLWYLNEDEKLALIEAYKQARRERFEAKVFHTLLTKPEEPELAMERMDASGKRLMQGAMWGGAVPKAEGANIVDHINQEFLKEYAKNRNT